jgi:hypothetical protein
MAIKPQFSLTRKTFIFLAALIDIWVGESGITDFSPVPFL